jgi:hypothetical protein
MTSIIAEQRQGGLDRMPAQEKIRTGEEISRRAPMRCEVRS